MQFKNSFKFTFKQLLLVIYKKYICLGIQITPIIYGHLIQWLSTLANGRIIVWEQGAHNNSVYGKEFLLECCKGLLDKSLSKLYMKKHSIFETKEIVCNIIQNHINIWQSLRF